MIIFNFPFMDEIIRFIEKCKKEHSVHYWVWEISTIGLCGLVLGLCALPYVYYLIYNVTLPYLSWWAVGFAYLVRYVWGIPVWIYEKRHGYKFNVFKELL